MVVDYALDYRVEANGRDITQLLQGQSSRLRMRRVTSQTSLV
ncbi:hypothetical protein [Halodesulfovibrio aestuarii]